MTFLITLTITLTGCEFGYKDAEKFVWEEQDSRNYAEYEKFMVDNLDNIQVGIRDKFITRLQFKPKDTVKEVQLINICIDEEDYSGKAMFSLKDSWEYRVVMFKYDSYGITEYRIKTLYGVK